MELGEPSGSPFFYKYTGGNMEFNSYSVKQQNERSQRYSYMGDPGSTADYPVNPSTPETNNYLSSNFFQFQLFRTSLITYFCQAVTIPSTNLSPIEMPNSLGRPNQFIGGRYSHEPLAVQFVVDEDMKNYQEIFNWLTAIYNYESDSNIIAGTQTKQFFSDASVLITNSSYTPKLKFNFKNTYPISLSAINFSSLLTDSEPVIATVQFNFETFSIESMVD